MASVDPAEMLAYEKPYHENKYQQLRIESYEYQDSESSGYIVVKRIPREYETYAQ